MRSLRFRLTLGACASVLVGLALPTAAAMAGEPGTLAPPLARLARPAVAAKPAAAQDEAIGMPVEGPGSIVREGDRVVVEAQFEEGALSQLEALRAAGAQVKLASRRYQAVALAIAPEDLDALAEVPGLSAVLPSRAPVFYGAGETVSTSVTEGNALCEGGSVISEGLQQMNVAAARAAFGARGAGETIGVLSDSFNSASKGLDGNPIVSRESKDEETGDLPGPRNPCEGQSVPVRVLAEAPSPGPEEEERTDEGRAMLQVVHDLAPHAELAFATAYSTELEFAHNIERLAEPVADGGAGADVIVDDVGYFAEPFYQDGPVAVAIDKVTAEGVTYLTAGGNDNLIETGTGNEFASWERSEYKDTSCPSVLVTKVPVASASNCMNFSPTGTDATYGITVEPESTLIVDLQWAEPWDGVESDLDAYLLDKEETKVLVDETIDNASKGATAYQEPVELLGWENTKGTSVEVQLVIDRCVQTCNPSASTAKKPRSKVILMQNGSGVSKVEHSESNAANGITVGPTVYGHAGAAAAITLGAVRYTQSATAPTEPERYSSRGPVTHYFDPVNGTSAAPALSTPEVVEKPNLIATDCASTTFFASHTSGWHFCGTSEAGPHGAAVAALMQETEPLASPGSIVEAMEESATPFTLVTSPAAVGAGMLNADAAITALGGSPVSDPPSVAKEASGGSGEESASEVTPSSSGTGTTGTAAGQGQAATPKADTTPPRVTITGPRKVVRTRRGTVVVHFALRADEAPVTFYCEFDNRQRRVCGGSFSHRFSLGPHVLKAWAEDGSGNVAEAPATYRFRVKRIRR